MSRIDSDIWTRLGEGRARGEFLWARWAAPDMTQRLLAAVDSNSKRHLLIRLQPGDAVLSDERSRGLEVATRDLSVPGQDIGRYLDVTCQDASGHEAFDLIGGELAERLAKERESAAECVTRVLAKWRRFWGEPPRQMLSREEQLGLFAELWFLSVWLVPRLGSDEAVKRWRGAFGARHDFEWPGRSVEVKATTSSRGAIHRIHGIEQLMPPDSGELLLFSLRLREEAGGGNSLPALVAACRQQLQVHDEASSRFETALAHAGYSQRYEEEYAAFRLRVVHEGLFVVRDDFPRITADQFNTGVPAGVEQVDYEINLSGFERFRVADSSSDRFPL